MTNFRRPPIETTPRLKAIAAWAGSWVSSCVLASLAAHPATAYAQNSGPRGTLAAVSPSSAVPAVTNSATVSLMGTTGIPSGEDNKVPSRQQLFMGLTQPVGRLGGVKFTAIGMGYWQMRDGVRSSSSAEGALALRATGRVNGVRTWGAVAYGRAGALGGMGLTSFAPNSPATGLDGAKVDTTVSRRVDVGSVARMESGFMASTHGFDMSMGLSMERATRVTTQTISIKPLSDLPIGLPQFSDTIVRTLRAVQRREIATGLASIGWRTGSTAWLTSITAPLHAWVTKDGLAAKPRVSPAIASLAVTQPLTAWLSAVGSASTNPSSIGSTALTDDAALSHRSRVAPVFALGVSIARVPFRNRHGESALGGILGFESRVIETLDSIIVVPDSSLAIRGVDAYRVQMVIDAPAAGSVDLMGDATAWTITNMSRGGDGRWRAELKLPAGAHRFTVRADNGEWIAPPGLPLVNNDFGGPVGLLVLEPQRIKR